MNKQLSSHFHAITLEPPIEDRLSQLKRDAEEAESLRDWSSAKQYLLDCVCLAPDDLLVHLDLAQCHGRCGEHDAALELLKTILNRNPKHVLALQTLGMLTPDLRLSETCFLNLVKFDPQQYTVLALLALHYDMINEGEKADTCATEATQQRKHEIYLDAAEIAVKAGATKYAEAAFSQYSLLDGSNIRGYLLRAKLYQQLNNFDVALSCLKAAKKIRIDHPEVCAALGHLYFSFDCFDEAKKNYEVLLSYYPELDDSKVLSRLATIYYKEALLDDWNLSSECKDEEKMKIAQRLFIQSKEWAWTGLTCLVLNQMEEAEAVLCKATTTNPRKPCSWIALSIFHLNEGHIFEAEQCANYALSLGLRNISILRCVF
ncbi:Cilia- and flagella-associated protein 70 [Coelomomyces lativittatus]|nr:Cilia- and flagella-associated protein 70 [Coelomomyces lativittatus]